MDFQPPAAFFAEDSPIIRVQATICFACASILCDRPIVSVARIDRAIPGTTIQVAVWFSTTLQAVNVFAIEVSLDGGKTWPDPLALLGPV
jgi:hypothetical protein